MVGAVRSWLHSHPLKALLALGLALRVLASCFSPGYLMHDDHFLVIETGASWAVGADYNNWLPAAQLREGIEHPEPHEANLTYPGIISGYFRLAHGAGLNHPGHQMLLLRLLHGLFSLLIVVWGYRIAERVGGSRPALWTGLALAAFGLFPLLSVRQLIEVVCIPPLLWSAWTIYSSEASRRTWRTWAVAGIGLGLATAVRYQCGVFGFGWIAAIWLHESSTSKAIRQSLFFGGTALMTFAVGQLHDILIWGEPFAQLRAYIAYNAENSAGYPQGYWHQYLWVFLGLLIPPFSIAWAFGTMRSWRSLAFLVLPALAFFVFHSMFPNKQERFILPAVPFFIIAGSVGWHAFESHSRFWKTHPTFRTWCAVFGTTLSLFAGIGLCFVQPKKSRVDAMTALYEQGDLANFLLVHTDGGAMPPQFYSGSWEKYWSSDLTTDAENHRLVMCSNTRYAFPNYLVFSGEQHLGEGVELYRQVYPSMEYVQQIPPSRWDRLLASLNDRNTVERFLIYRISPTEACPPAE